MKGDDLLAKLNCFDTTYGHRKMTIIDEIDSRKRSIWNL
jgi:hypothetical protein